MKKWLYGIISLIMLGSGIAVAMPNDFVAPCEDGNVEVTAPKQETPNQDNSNSSSESDYDNSNDDNSGDNSSDEPSQEPEESEEITTYEFRTINDYLIDNDLTKQTITENDLTGIGTETNPYVVHSTNGFCYLMKQPVVNKYIELNCDVVLNEETFDEDGNPSGGDGIVYDWNEEDLYYFYFDGNGHDIRGIYSNHPDKNSLCFFGSLREIHDVSFSNVFMFGKETVSLTSNTDILKNCTIKSGYILGKEKVAGLTIAPRKLMENCVNYASVRGKVIGSVPKNHYYSGLAYCALEGASVLNCKNYGCVFGYQNVSGIMGYNAFPNVTIENCENYGDIEATLYFSSGIVGMNSSSRLKISNCRNYGTIITPKENSRPCGGIVANDYSGCLISNCKNLGEFTTEYCAGEMVGYLQQTSKTLKSYILTIVNCQGYGGCSFIGATHGASIFPEDTKITIANSYLNHYKKALASNYKGMIISSIAQGIKNLNIDIKDVTIDVDVDYFRLFGGFNDEVVNINIKNLYIKAKCTRKMTMELLTFINSNPNRKYNFESMIVNSTYNNEIDRFYVGSDFSGFFYKNKTGEFGLKNYDLAGSFDTPVTEEFLQSKLFVKEEF